MKKRYILMALLLLLISAWLIGKVVNKWYFKHYAFLQESPHSEHLDFVIKRVSCNSIHFHYNNPPVATIVDKNGAALPDTLPPKDDYLGWIYADTIKQQYYFKETYYAGQEEKHRWITLNKDGILTDSTAIDSLMPPSTSILLKDEKGNFPDWDDKRSIAYMNYFAREEFNWGILNPFKGMGNPTGGGPIRYWFGYGYFTINHNGEKIKFKEETSSMGGGRYTPDPKFSVTPASWPQMLRLTFIVLDNSYEHSGLYVIVKNK